MNTETCKTIWKKFRYAILILLLGLLLVCMPSNKSQEKKTDASAQGPPMTTSEAENELETLLSQMKGVGEASVLLAYQCSEERIYTKDDGSTVVLNVGSGKQEALERKTVYPIYQGAVIVCSGAEDASVQLRVTEAVRQYTGLRTDQISVLPMA